MADSPLQQLVAYIQSKGGMPSPSAPTNRMDLSGLNYNPSIGAGVYGANPNLGARLSAPDYNPVGHSSGSGGGGGSFLGSGIKDTIGTAGHAAGSAWHGILEGMNRVGSVVPNFVHDVEDYHRQHVLDNGGNTALGLKGLPFLFEDLQRASGDSLGQSLIQGKHDDFSKVIQHTADMNKADTEDAKNGTVTQNKDIKEGSAYVNPYLKGWAGFGADVVTNPLNVVGAGTVAKAGELAKFGRGAQTLSNAEIAAAPIEKQLALRLGSARVPLGIPAIQLGKRIAESELPLAKNLTEKFRPLANAINNPHLRNAAKEAEGGASAAQYNFMHNTLGPILSKYTAAQQKTLLSDALRPINGAHVVHDLSHTDPVINTIRQHVIDLATKFKAAGVSSDVFNQHLIKDLHLPQNLSTKKVTVTLLAEHIAERAAEHGETASYTIGKLNHAFEHGIEGQHLYNLVPKIKIPGTGAVAHNFIKAKKKLGYTTVSHIPELRGHMVHQSIVDQLNNTQKFLHQRIHNTAAAQMLRKLDTTNRLFKQYNVSLNPASQARRVLGNFNQQVINGHFDPASFQKAVRVMRNHDPLYRDDNGLGKLVAGLPGYVGPQRVANEIVARVGGHSFTTNDVYAAASRKGVFGNFVRTQVRNLNDVARTRVGKAAHKLTEKSLNLSEHSDNSFRMATFLHALKQAPKGLTKDQMLDFAANEAKRTHLDFSSLTPFERSIMTRMMPFYGAVSRSVPIAFRQLVARPGFSSVLPKAEQDWSNSFGPKPTGWENAIPQYLQNNGGLPLGMFKGQPVVLDQKNDITDAYQNFLGGGGATGLIGQPLKAAGSLLAPGLKIPTELAFNTNLFTGAPTRGTKAGPQGGIDPQTLTKYFSGMIPWGAVVNREQKQNAGNTDRNGKPIDPNLDTGNSDWHIDPTLLRLLGLGTNVVTSREESNQIKNARVRAKKASTK